VAGILREAVLVGLGFDRFHDIIVMRELADLFSEERVACLPGIGSKKRLLEVLSDLLVKGNPGLFQNEVFACLCERERLGGTGLGRGVAIPHGRLVSLQRPVCAFIKLRQGVDYDVADGQPVDLICGLVVPLESTHDHLDILASLAEMFSDSATCLRLRAAADSKALCELLMGWQAVVQERVAES